jgi:ectoine hydroxylase-related dioxygenase (phytanoyl-CoA dioxygenase family)
MVQQGALSLARIESANIASMKQHFRKSGLGSNVFFDNPFDPADLEHNSRQQIVTKEYGKVNRDFLTATQKKFLAYCERTVKATAAAILAYKDVNKKLKVVESLLYSAAMNQEIQVPHRDLEDNYAESAVLCLLALEEETTILLTKGTHEMDYDRRNYFISRYELSKGDILFFHPCLIHAGDAYRNSNLRLHYYVFVKSAEWDINQTYLLDNEDEEMLRSSEANLVMNLNRMISNQRRSKKRAERAAEKRELSARRKANLEFGRAAKRNKNNSEE